MKLRTLGCFLFLLLAREAYSYKVVSVLDGDTIQVSDGNLTFRVRIAAMDAPEKGQPYSKMASAYLKKILGLGEISIKPVGTGHDRYGRVLGEVFAFNKDIALLMIQEGLATYYRPFCRDYPADKKKYDYDPEKYIEAEKEARNLRKNFWSIPKPTLPCYYRHLKN